jgi:hypothetical protein
MSSKKNDNVAKKEKSKLINKAQKTPNDVPGSYKIVDKDTVIIQIPKEEIEGSLTSILTVGLAFALNEIGVEGLNITIKEDKKSFSITVEK